MTKKVQQKKENKGVIYMRVSDKSQVLKGHSIKEQEPILRQFSRENGYIVKKVLSDKGKSVTSTVDIRG